MVESEPCSCKNYKDDNANTEADKSISNRTRDTLK
jgi:hypothetical protein